MYSSHDPASIQLMFATIAKDYDRANHLMSFGLCNLWNNALVREFKSSALLLDLCAGTGEIAFRFLKRNPNSKAILLDFSPEMLFIAKEKGKLYRNRFETIEADATVVPLKNGSVDGISVAYGIRNISTPVICFQEAYRVLKPGSKFVILELTRPKNPFFHFSHHLYLNTLLPIVGKFATRNKEAYEYLSRSITSFSSPALLKEALQTTGFQTVKIRPLMGGIATLLIATK